MAVVTHAEKGSSEALTKPNIGSFKVRTGVTEAIERWLGQLSNRTLLVTAIAAVIGQQFNLTCLQRVYEATNEQLLDALGEAVRAGIVIPLLAAGQRGFAAEKFEVAISIYRLDGAGERWVERLQTERSEALNGAKDVERRPVPMPASAIPHWRKNGGVEQRSEGESPRAIFRKEGEYWTLSLTTAEIRLKHRKGLHYIANLLRYPDEEFSAQDLISAVEPSDSMLAATAVDESRQTDTIGRSLGDTGAILDPTAKAQYKARLEDLNDEFEEAERLNDIGRAARARGEIEFIRHELAAAIGLGGRDRKSASHAERARLAATKAIKSALEQIRQADPELGRHLTLSIRTGYFCAYEPRQNISWQL